MPPKQKTQEFQRVLSDEADYREAIGLPSPVVIEVHPSWCGPCECIKEHFWRYSLQNDKVVFCTAPSDKIPSLKEYNGTVRPVFLLYENGQKKLVVEGPNLPVIYGVLDK